jgi:5'-3' exoribonuclease 2
MGVPGLFAALSRRYPFIVQAVCEGDGAEEVPWTDGVDELYIDWNQVVHNCTHANKALASKPEAQQLEEMCAYCLRLVSTLQPRSLLMQAVDGVAPAAKIAQQRTRRYTSALRRAETARHRSTVIREIAAEHGGVDGADLLVAALEQATKDTFDSNVITPGTPFMARMERALHSWLVSQLADNPSFAELEVVWSPSSDPGEGEHKIMQFLRRRRCLPGYAPNACRIIVGQDADLLLLALATHEPRVMVLREQFSSEEGADSSPVVQVVSVAALREALQWEFASILGGEQDDADDDSDEDEGSAEPGAEQKGACRARGGLDVERVIDDVVVLSCLLGNDFLPVRHACAHQNPCLNLHSCLRAQQMVPSLEIHERPSGLEAVWDAYRKSVVRHGYITQQGEVLDRGLSGVLRILADGESTRLQYSAQQLERRARSAARRVAAEAADDAEEDLSYSKDWDLGEVNVGAAAQSRAMRLSSTPVQQVDVISMLNSPEAMAALVDVLRRRVEERVDAAFSPVPADRLRLGTPGDSGRYYAHHFSDLLEKQRAQSPSTSEADLMAAVTASISASWLEGMLPYHIYRI